MDNPIENKPPAPAVSAGTRAVGFFLDLLETCVLAFLVFLGIQAGLGRVCIESISMEPTLYRGEMVMVDKVSPHFSPLQRGDVIVFHPPLPEKQPYIKRVIGLPGDDVLIQDGELRVNRVPIREMYVKTPASYRGAWHVPQNQLFVLGDNRDRSSDSHIWGMVPLKNVMGKAFLIYWPPQQAGAIRGLPGFSFH